MRANLLVMLVSWFVAACAGQSASTKLPQPEPSGTTESLDRMEARLSKGESLGPPKRAVGRSFSVPIPVGFKWLREPGMMNAETWAWVQNGAVILHSEERRVLGMVFLGSIVIASAGTSREPNLDDDRCCATVKELALSLRAPLKSCGLVPVGPL